MRDSRQGEFGFAAIPRLRALWASEDFLALRAALALDDEELAAIVALGMHPSCPIRSIPLPARFAAPELEPIW